MEERLQPLPRAWTRRGLTATALLVAFLGTTATPAAAEPSLGDIRKRITKASEDLEDVIEAYNKLRVELKETEAASDKLTTALGPVRDQLTVARDDVGTIAARAYMSGPASATGALFTGAGDLMDRLGMLEHLSRTRQQHVTRFAETARLYEDQQTVLRGAQAKQAAQGRELNARKKKIEADLEKLYEMRRQAYGRAESAPTGGYTGSIPAVSGKAGVAVRFAYNAIGKPYRYGADGPAGYDCSGLTSAAWRAAGRSLPHNAAMQYGVVAKIPRSALRAGDLVFYRGLGHVALYVGNNKIIDAPHAGVRVGLRSINIMSIVGYGRVR